jgi:hypothetical protein
MCEIDKECGVSIVRDDSADPKVQANNMPRRST